MAETLKKDRAHQRYYLEIDGKKVRLPGATSITGVLNKPALVPWANRLGLDGIDVQSYKDSRAEMGTCAHDMVESYLQGKEPYLDEFSKSVINSAENSMLSFLEGMKGHEYEILGIEMQLVSAQYRYGGTCDIYWILDGKKTLTDLKTGKAIYPEMKDQVAAYKQLLVENGSEVEQVTILNIPRGDDEQYIHEYLDPHTLSLHFERFCLCRQIYELNKTLNKW